MKTVAFSDILAEVCQVVGLDRSTLTDKSFATIRDTCSRRLNMVWDREAWPDNQRWLYTFPGIPVTSFTKNDNYLLTEGDVTLSTESDSDLLVNTPTGTYTLTLNTDFPRAYLEDFSTYRTGGVAATTLNIGNAPVQLTVAGDTENLGDFVFTLDSYTTATDSDGFAYITTVTITATDGDLTTTQSTTTNGKATPTVVFNDNLKLLIQAPTDASEILNVFASDPRTTTRVIEDSFLVDEFDDLNAQTFRSEYSYIRASSFGKKHIHYRQLCPRLTGLKLSVLVTYSAGSQVYYDTLQGSGAYSPTSNNLGTKGDFWEAQTTTTNAPSASNADWKMVEIPHRYKDYLTNGIASDIMRSEGRFDEAGVYEGLAEAAIQQQIDVLVRQQGQIQRMNMIFTY
jgi:hypothetical protein